MVASIAPVLFVLIWSSGFVVARAVAPHAAPELALLARMLLTASLLGTAAMLLHQQVPRGPRLALHLLAGALLNGIYLCTSWWAIGKGMPAGIMALLGALQPLVVSVVSFLILHERLSLQGWTGMGIGLGGVVLVLLPLLGSGESAPVSIAVVVASVASIIAMAAGTMIQRGSLALDSLCIAGATQNVGGAVIAAIATGVEGTFRWDNSLMLWLALAWSVVMLSAAALSLLVWMTRHQGATKVSLLLLLVPPLAAIEARILFGERLTSPQLLGFAVTLAGVVLARMAVQRPSTGAT